MSATQRAFVVTPSHFILCLAVPVAHAQSFSGLGFLPGGTQSTASRVNRDGSVVVGVLMSPDYAMLWTSSLGMVNLNTYLPSLGINLTGWTLTAANGVRGDGRTLVGKGMHNGSTEAWVAHLPSPTAVGRVPDGAEGSYGTASDGVQRPPSATSCRPQVFTGCM
jgi:uncharacterized membrane protein